MPSTITHNHFCLNFHVKGLLSLHLKFTVLLGAKQEVDLAEKAVWVANQRFGIAKHKKFEKSL